MRKDFAFLLGLAASLAFVGVAEAAVIPVANADFEATVLSTNFSPAIDNWEESGGEIGTADGVVRSGVSGGNVNIPAPPSLHNWAFISASEFIWQNIGTVDTSQTYTIAFTVGNRSDQDDAAGIVALWGGGTAPNAGAGSTLLGSAVITNPADGGTLLQSHDIAPTTNNGDALWLIFSNNGVGQLLVDDVSVNAVPEPGSLALLGLGGLLVLRRRKN